MKIEIEEITISINKAEAFDIINCITEASPVIELKPKYPDAYEFTKLLRNIFMNSVNGIHTNFK